MLLIFGDWQQVHWVKGIRLVALLWTAYLCHTWFTCWNLNAQCHNIWMQGFGEVVRLRWGHQVGWNPRDRVSVFIRRVRNPSALSAVWRYNKIAVTFRPERWPSSKTWPCWYSDLRPPDFRTVRSKCHLSHTVSGYSVTAVWTDQEKCVLFPF